MTAKKAFVWAVIALVVLSFIGLEVHYALNP